MVAVVSKTSVSALELMAMSMLTEKARVAKLALMMRDGRFGYELQHNPTIADCYAVINATSEPRGAKIRLKGELYEEFYRQMERRRSREHLRARMTRKSFELEDYDADRFMPLGASWPRKSRKRGIKARKCLRAALRLPEKYRIPRLAHLARKNRFGNYQESRSRAREGLRPGGPAPHRVDKYDADWLLPLHKFYAKERRQRALALKRSNVSKLRLLCGKSEEWDISINSYRIRDHRTRNGLSLVCFAPSAIYDSIDRYHYCGYSGKSKVNYLAYRKGEHYGVLRISPKADTIDEALESLKRKPVKMAEACDHDVQIDWENWGFHVRNPKRKKPRFLSFKLAEKSESMFPSRAGPLKKETKEEEG